MIALVAERKEELAELCRRFQVRQLDLFGSAATSEFDPEISDLDFLVVFDPAARVTYVGGYYRLQQALAELFGRPVNLVIDADFSNPEFRATVEQSRIPLYAA